MSRSCKECAHHNPDFIDKVCLHCSWPEFVGEPSNFKPKPITHGDSVRSMTDEELAEAICRLELLLAKQGHRGFQAWLDWLKEAVD